VHQILFSLFIETVQVGCINSVLVQTSPSVYDSIFYIDSI